MTDATLAVGLAAVGYLLGSVPFGVLAAKLLGTHDPRSAGSRNIGFTNVLRVSGKTAGILTLVGDMGKGWLIAFLAARWISHPDLVLIVSATPVIGHLYPVFLRFQGGKGVATAFGALLGARGLVGLIVVGIWLGTAAIWRYSSGSAVMAFAMLPIVAAVTQQGWSFMMFSIMLSGAVLWRHKDNIRRLWAGTEPKMGRRPIGDPVGER